MSRTDMPEWKRLEEQAKGLKDQSIAALFDQDPKRYEAFHAAFDGIMMDYSKTSITNDVMSALLSLAKACDVEGARDRMFAGEPVNNTENRAVLHTALRMDARESLDLNGVDIIPEIHGVLGRMQAFSDKIRAEKKFTHIVNIGIGGSDLGAYMACEALKAFCDRDIKMHFVSNVDSTDLAEALLAVKPEKTLFIVTSKSFTTQETMTNARSARAWLEEKLGRPDVDAHFVAITANTDEARRFGMDDESIFPMWDWVGGRYSIWSAIGLPVCISVGFDNFSAMLAGAREMDRHFCAAPLEKNLPVLFGMVGVWHRNFCDFPAVTVAPYDQYLHSFIAYLQQLDMESNGKRVDRDGNVLDYETGPIVFGKPGTNGQHAFFQLIHQGTTVIPVEFIAALQPQQPMGDHHKKLMSNCIGQSKALMDGLRPGNTHKEFTGSRPSVTILLDVLDPYHLGMLMALYEQKVFVQGIIWNINSFDQWGVQLGKVLADKVMAKLDGGDMDSLDSSTAALVNAVKAGSVRGE
ncbi:MAG: glucose-6-phosphate isomerase [Alphaproteobacteria bacterium]|nr:glucose-6-phosphate isomerase [Alphaproteobacteria bacterium]